MNKTRQTISRVTIATAQAAGEMPNHWIVKLEMVGGYVRLIPCATWSHVAVCVECLPIEYEMGAFIEESPKEEPV